MNTDTEKQAAECDQGDILFQRAYLPAYIKVAQARGLEIKTEADLEQLLKISAMLNVHAAAEESQGGNLLQKASSALERITYGDESADQSAISVLTQDPAVMAAAGAIEG